MTTAEYLARDRHLRRAQQEVATLWILAEHRTRVALEAIGTNVFVHAGKGPLQGRRIREFNETWLGACQRAGYTGTLLHDLRRCGVTPRAWP